MVVWLALASAFLAAVNNVTMKQLLNGRMSPAHAATMSFLLMAGMMALFSPFYFRFERVPAAIVLMLTIGMLDAVQNFFYYLALSLTEVGTASIYFSLGPLFALIAGIITGRADGVWSVLPATIIITLAVAILNFREDLDVKALSRKATAKEGLIALGSAFFAGVSAVVAKVLLGMGVTNPPTLFLFRCILVFAFLAINQRPRLWENDAATWGMVAVRGGMVIARWMCLLYAIQLGNVVVSVAVSNAAPFFVLLLSLIFFHEKLTGQKVIASLLVVAGVTFLQFKGH